MSAQTFEDEEHWQVWNAGFAKGATSRDAEVAAPQAKLTEAERKLTMAENRAELFAEDIECLHMCLDDIGVPRTDGGGNVYSMWGRVQIAFRSNAIKEIEGSVK
jgi:hypothetical protein